MDIKSLPTDNLYKFITIFSIALMFSCAYGSVAIYDSHLKQYQSVKGELFKTKKNDKSAQNQEKRKYFLEQVRRIESDKKTLLYFTFTGFLFSIAGGVFGFFLWKSNLQKYLDLQIELETKKLQHEVESVNK